MTLLDNMKLLMSQTPNPPVPEIVAISDALELAITTNIRAGFVPGFGQVFVASLSSPNPFLLALGAHFDLTITPIISVALAAQSSIGTVPAWISVQPSFDALSIAAPPFMAGILGLLFWQAILITVRLAILPPTLTSSGGSEGSREEVLRVDS